MHAEVGDWLLVKASGVGGGHERRAAVLEVGPDGSPPFKVRWLDNDREALIFPGPDTERISAKRQQEIDREEVVRLARVQSAITAAQSGEV